jgi:hypothetical protein
MLELGYKLMSEEHGPLALVHNVRRAEHGSPFRGTSRDSLTRSNAGIMLHQ